MPVSIDRMPNKPHIQRGANGTAATVRPVQGAGPQGPPGPGNSNADVAGYVTGAGPTQTALLASLVPKWQPNTNYTAGYAVLAPDGSLVKAKTTFTSGATYSAANWTSAATYAGTQAQSELATAVLAWIAANTATVQAPAPSGDTTGATDRAAIQALFDGLTASAGGRVVLRPGTYYLNTAMSPTTTYEQSALFLRSGMSLVGSGTGTILRVKAGVTRNGSLNAAGHVSVVNNYDTTGNENIAVHDLLVEGDAGNQTIDMYGIRFGKCRNVTVRGVTVQNIFGGSNGFAATETFCFDSWGSANVKWTDCVARGTSSAFQTSSGFSANTSTDVSWVDCTAYGLGGMGFTHWTCSNVRTTGCYAYANGLSYNAYFAARGFNSELSDSVTYTGCISGGRAAHTTGNGFLTDQQNLGNHYGFCISGSTNVDLVGCQAEYNTASGLWLAANGGTVPPDSVRVIGGSLSNNGTWGIERQSGTNISISAATRIVGNTTAPTAGIDVVFTGDMPNTLSVGEETLDAALVTGGPAYPASGRMCITYFTAKRNETISKVRMASGGTAAGATPTLIRIGIYTVDASGNLDTLVASTPNTTSMFAATFTEYTTNLSASFNKVAGQRYAVALLIVSGATLPAVAGCSPFVTARLARGTRKMFSEVVGQTDLPSTVAVGSMVNFDGRLFWTELAP